MSATIAALYDVEAESYERTRGRSASFQSQCRLIDRWIRDRSGHLLDVGCGSGDFLMRAGGRFERCIGVDASPRMIEAARRKLVPRRNLDLHVADAAALPVETGTIDVLVTMGVIEFIDDLESLLREFHRVLAPGGRLLITTQHGACLAKRAGAWTRSAIGRIRRRPVPDSHRRRPVEFRGGLNQAGFVVRESAYCGVRAFPWPLSDVPRLVRPVEGLLERLSFVRNNPWTGSVYALCADKV